MKQYNLFNLSFYCECNSIEVFIYFSQGSIYYELSTYIPRKGH